MSRKKVIDHFIDDDSFVRWIDGSADEQERNYWNEWMNTNPEHKDLVDDLTQIHSHLKFKASEGLDIEGELNKLNQSIDSYNRKSKIHTIKKRKNSVFTVLPKIAAAFLILASVTVIYQMVLKDYKMQDQADMVEVEYTVTTTENGQMKILQLADGSKITLNANSTLEYPTKYSSGDIEVRLKGEAYFDIKKLEDGRQRNFTVHLDRGDLNVLGTSFNINAYTDESVVYLEEGSVNLRLLDEEKRVKDSYVMSPGDLSILDKETDKIQTKSGKTNSYSSWINNKLVFENSTLLEVGSRLGNIYGVEFRFENPAFSSIEISGSLPNNNLSVFINALNQLIDQPVNVQEDTVFVGTEAAFNKEN